MAPAPTIDLASTWRHAVQWLLPTDCAGCGTPLTDDPIPFFCRACWAQIAPWRGPACSRCDRPFASPVATLYTPQHQCGPCRQRGPAYTRAWTPYAYEPPLQDAIVLLKYRSKVDLAAPLADLLLAARPAWPDVDLIMPVPLHPDRLREREFNQALLLADRVSRALGHPLSYTNLVRTKRTEHQTTLSRSARLKNLRGAFAVRHPEAITGRRILVIDDVMTTGTTVNECAKALRKAGSADVYVMTLARTL